MSNKCVVLEIMALFDKIWHTKVSTRCFFSYFLGLYIFEDKFGASSGARGVCNPRWMTINQEYIWPAHLDKGASGAGMKTFSPRSLLMTRFFKAQINFSQIICCARQMQHDAFPGPTLINPMACCAAVKQGGEAAQGADDAVLRCGCSTRHPQTQLSTKINSTNSARNNFT